MKYLDDSDIDESGDDIFSLSDAIGPRRRNDRADVLKVETLLANTGDHDLEDGPTGYPGSGLDTAIRAYQKRRSLAVDGVLEPAGETITNLDRELRPRMGGFRAPRPDEADEHLNRAGQGKEPLLMVLRQPPMLHDIPDLPPVDGGAWQSNGRTARALFQTKDNAPLADLAASVIEDGGLGAVAEVRDLIDQISERDPKRAAAMARAVFDRLSDEGKQRFTGGDGEQPEHGPIGVVPTELPQLAQSNPIRTPATSNRAMPPTSGDLLSPGGPPPAIPVPGYRNKVPDVSGFWQTWADSVRRLPNLSAAEERTYMEIFAAEGGLGIDKRSRAASGITPETYLDVTLDKLSPHVAPDALPENLTPDERADVYRRYFDKALANVGKASGALEGIGDPHAAAAFADAIFNHGAAGGSRAIQHAINDVEPGTVTVDGGMGLETYDAFRRLARDPQTKWELLESLADRRRSLPGAEQGRIDLFRFREENPAQAPL